MQNPKTVAKGRPRSPAAKALPGWRAWLTLRARRPAATVATKGGGVWQSAVCGGGHEMTAGVHCAHFELRELGYANLGVTGPGFDPAASGVAYASAEGWVMATWNGDLCHGGVYSEWVGQPQEDEIKGGDVVVRRPPCVAL